LLDFARVLPEPACDWLVEVSLCPAATRETLAGATVFLAGVRTGCDTSPLATC
jgi:hypothetical protein